MNLLLTVYGDRERALCRLAVVIRSGVGDIRSAQGERISRRVSGRNGQVVVQIVVGNHFKRNLCRPQSRGIIRHDVMRTGYKAWRHVLCGFQGNRIKSMETQP